jgi:uncharacterized protein YjiS (DUF1127 family)
MFANDENAFYYNGLPPDEWARARRRIIGRAQAARARALRDLARAVLRPVATLAAAVAATAGKWWRAYALRRERNAAVRELRALDDRTLKDIGINRCEIEWVVDGKTTRDCGTRPSRPTVLAGAIRPRAPVRR